ncbi:RNA-binding protein squid [Parasteatoda tepidariorum]|uniref:RNA-binding protein squid n=1 Tax=Parasteatoda tepidariorum TaxID=114398 RepID=UPI00077FA884|nr:RNA-binding protein squid [Parasteatoda tepidariorum]
MNYEDNYTSEEQNCGDFGTDFNDEQQQSNGDVEDQGGSGDAASGSKSSEEDKKLFIGGISRETNQKDLKEYFSKFGEVTEVNIKTDPTSGRSRGFAFVAFASRDSVDSVLHNGPHTIKGKQIEAKRAKVRPGIKKIFVGGIESDMTEADIRNYFEHFGKVETVELPFDKVKNQRRQFCFVTFEDEMTVDQVCKQAKQKIGNKECDVKKATTKPDPRLARGGGMAGRGRGRGGPPGWGPDYGMPGYGGYGGNQGYGGYGGGYGDYSGGYGGYSSGYGGGPGGYGSYGGHYNGWGGYGQNGYSGGGYGAQQPPAPGKARRGTTTGQGYQPY